jgi:hypothetical protein
MPTDPRKALWNTAARNAAKRLRLMYPDDYARLVSDEARRLGLTYTRKPRRTPVTPLSATTPEEETP